MLKRIVVLGGIEGKCKHVRMTIDECGLSSNGLERTGLVSGFCCTPRKNKEDIDTRQDARTTHAGHGVIVEFRYSTRRIRTTEEKDAAGKRTRHHSESKGVAGGRRCGIFGVDRGSKARQRVRVEGRIRV
jgi:hypothetical protein